MTWEWAPGIGWMLLFMVVFWIGAFLLIVWGVRHFTRSRRHEGSRALEILKERYARGEIDRDEFESRRRDLSADR